MSEAVMLGEVAGGGQVKRLRWIWLVCLVVPVGCGAKAGGGSEKQLQECVRGLEAARLGSPERNLQLVATACGFSCKGLGAYASAPPGERLKALVEGCSPLCSAKASSQVAGAAPAERGEAAVSACGAAYWGLGPGQEALWSPSWLVAHEVGRWLAQTRRKHSGNSKLIAELDRALQGLRLLLPLPSRAAGRYTLARSSRSRDHRATVYVIVGRDTASVGTWPEAHLGADGAEISGTPEQAFPGLTTPAAGLAGKVQELRAENRRVLRDPDEVVGGTGTRMKGEEGRMGQQAPPDTMKPGPPAGRDIPYDVARRSGVLGALEDLDRVLEAPLLLADAALPASRLLAVYSQLAGSPGIGGARLAVAGLEGAAEHQVELGPPGPDTFTAQVVLGKAGYRVSQPGGEAREIVRAGDALDTAALTAALEASSLPKSGLSLAIDGDEVTVAELVATLDAAAEAGFRVAHLTVPSALGAGDTGSAAWGQAGTGAGTGSGVIGLGTIGTIGHRSGTGSGTDYRQRPAVPSLLIGEARTTGDLSAAIVRRELRKNQPRFVYCYQKQLLSKPKLAGTLSAAFTVTGSGSVRGARVTGFDPELTACVTGTLNALIFPKPADAGLVVVTVPFVFQVRN